jgi:hypothetical protein
MFLVTDIHQFVQASGRSALYGERQKKVPATGTFFYFHQPHYFLPPLTLAIMKMINAIKPTTSKMPHTMPALKIPSTTEQLPKHKAKKQTREKINNLILIFFSLNQIAYLFLFQ